MKIYPSDWLTNAGIVGFLRMQNYRGKSYDLSKGYIDITESDLEDFEQVYFTYTLIENLNPYPEDTFKALQDKSLNLRNEDYRDLLQKIRDIQSNYINTFKPDPNSFENTINSLEKVMINIENDIINAIEDELKKNVTIVTLREKIINNIKKEAEERRKKVVNKEGNFIFSQLQRFYFNKAVIGNPSSKGSRVVKFKEKYIDPAIEIICNPSEGNITCKFCKKNKVNIDRFNDDSEIFFNEGMFSTVGVSQSKFLNFYYNYQPDLVICSLCQLLLLCAFAGFTSIPRRFQDDINNTTYIFVNLPNLELLWDENDNIKKFYESSKEDVTGTIYEEIFRDLFIKEKEKKSLWVLNNILFIELGPVPRKDVEKPRFVYFHMGKRIANLFRDDIATEYLRYIRGYVIIENNRITLERDVIRRILTNESLYPLCFYLLKNYLDKEQVYLRNVYIIALLAALLYSMYAHNKELTSKQVYGILESFRKHGEEFAERLSLDERIQKSYKLLSLIRTGKIVDFYDYLLKMYMNDNKPVPDTIISLLNKEDQIDFYSKAYAFMSGFLSEVKQDIKQK